jgi:hypothetical protein
MSCHAISWPLIGVRYNSLIILIAYQFFVKFYQLFLWIPISSYKVSTIKQKCKKKTN